MPNTELGAVNLYDNMPIKKGKYLNRYLGLLSS